MASCFYCQKKTVTGWRVSHSAIKTKRKFHPNLHALRVRFNDGGVKRVSLCSKCYKLIAGKVKKGVSVPFTPLSVINRQAKEA